MQFENPLPPWLRQALIGFGLFMAGAILAFGYSYRPLHGALSWQVEQLQETLDERNRENLRLSDALAKQKSEVATRIDPETLAQVERELEQTQRVLRQAESDLKRAERKRKESVSSAATWRKRYEELRDAPSPTVASAPEARESEPGADPVFEVAPAAPSGAPLPAPSTGRSPAPTESGILPANETAEPAMP